ncbi:Alpha-1,2 glucosyltransferase alg-10 [Paramyrothecium foliicola]|nr:Alpha-1,2 glucosyltransferase alg-10 [Paramyrothecium foliicola]
MVSRTPFRAAEFRSAYGPKYVPDSYPPTYHYQPNFAGFTSQSALRLGLKSAAFGGSLGVALVLFVSGIPRVQKDILQKLPIVGSAFVKEPVHPADNDEVFHIPQAQRYCQGRFREWDDKITTPPGLYLLSVLASRTLGLTAIEGALCDPRSLRAISAVSLLVLTYLSMVCRQRIERQLRGRETLVEGRGSSIYAAHTAVNIGFFPLLFFFSGLYYTDVVSTTVVIVAFLNHLSRLERQTGSLISDVKTIILGLLTLFMRQTNVFWVVVFMGGLEAVHAVTSLHPQPAVRPSKATVLEQIKYSISRYAVGAVHDLPLNQAWPDDALFTILSLGIAAICNPVPVIRQIWPYVTVLGAFVAFVAWNGSVVLGDKSNHVATLHLAQMLYIWPFFAFFSLPLIVPSVFPALGWIHQTLVGGKTRTSSAQPRLTDTTKHPETSRKSDVLFTAKLAIWLLYASITGVISVAVVRYNTIIHPFTLADNRHYMFYVFRYTIRRAPWIKYFLILPYTASRWLVWATFAGCYERAYGFAAKPNSSTPSGGSKEVDLENYPVWLIEDGEMNVKASTKPPKELQKAPFSSQLTGASQPVRTSTGLIFLLTTSLSLITAPLVEPRYFILPWVIWRLLIPAWQPRGQESPSQKGPEGQVRKLVEKVKDFDLRLFFETVWFLAINVATGYIFLTRPYQWKAADGTLLDQGRWQRFMW